MPTRALRKEERDQNRINEAVAQLQQGRSNAHGDFTATDDGVAVSTVVLAPTCGLDSTVIVVPSNADAGALTPWYVVAGNGSFEFFHPTTTDECTFRWSIHG